MKNFPRGLWALVLGACLACSESGDNGGGGKGTGGASSGGSTASGGAVATGGAGGVGATGGTGGVGATGGTQSGGAAGTSTGGSDAGLPACPTFADGVKTGNVAFAGVTEASGIVDSRKNKGVLWINNDSGDGPKLYALAKDGTHLGVFTFGGAQAADWEDIATGPGPQAGESYLYVGDIGDNPSTRPNIKIYRVAEPSVSASGPASNVTLSGVETFTYTYPDGPHNAESLMVDPKTKDVFIVVKASSGKSPVFRASAPLASGVLQEVATLTFGVAPLPGGTLTTGADISAAGDAVLIRTYGSAFSWRRGAAETVAQALAGEPCPVPQKAEPQGEAIGFAADGLGFYTVSEGVNQPVYFYAKN